MLRAVLAALALATGMPLAAVVTVWLIATVPLFGLVVGVGWAAVARRRAVSPPGPDDEATLLHGLAAEMAAGAAPRSALAGAARRVPRLDLSRAVRLAVAGMPADRVAPALQAALAVNGRLVAGAWLLAARSGGPASDIFHSLALRSSEVGALRRERRALTAQARASAWVVAGLPVALLSAMAVTGRLDFSDPALTGVIAVGMGLQLAGVGVVVTMLRRAR